MKNTSLCHDLKTIAKISCKDILSKTKIDDSFIIFNDLGAKALQSFCWDLCNSHKRIKLFLGIFIVIPLASNANPNPPWDTSDAPAPDMLV